MYIQPFKDVVTSDGILCFKAGKVYKVRNREYYTVTLYDERGELNALLNGEFKVTLNVE